MFKENDRVMINCKEVSKNEELAFVCSKICDGYEVVLLMDHKPGSTHDPVRSFVTSEMRIATQEEIDIAMTKWENKNNYKLRR
jgi:hypothetical protein